MTEKEAWLECARIWAENSMLGPNLCIDEFERHFGICHTISSLLAKTALSVEVYMKMFRKIKTDLDGRVYLFERDELGKSQRVDYCIARSESC